MACLPEFDLWPLQVTAHLPGVSDLHVGGVCGEYDNWLVDEVITEDSPCGYAAGSEFPTQSLMGHKLKVDHIQGQPRVLAGTASQTQGRQ
jgi:hypothetical protein